MKSMKRLYIYLFCAAIFFESTSYAQTNVSVDRNTFDLSQNLSNKALISSVSEKVLSGLVSDTVTLPLTVRHWNKTDILTASAIACITIGLYQYDQKIHHWTQHQINDISIKVARFAEPFGGKHSMTPAALLYIFGYMSDDNRAQHVAMLGFKSVLISSFFTSTVKTYGHRHRPNSGDPYNRWDGPSLSLQNLSFPSGHSTASFAMATVIATVYKDKLFIPPLAYGMAALTALSRVHDNKHWASDIFIGSAIGYFTSKALMKMYNGAANNISIAPATTGNITGITVGYKF